MMQSMKQFGKKDEIYGKETLFREIGYYILRLDYYEKSMKVFDDAIKNTPEDIRALIGRSRSRAKASQYKGALEDINKALKRDSQNLQVLAEKALVTYLNSQFADGLLQNSRLLLKREKPDHFALGVMYCSNALETCLGESAGKPLRDHFKIIRKLAWNKNRSLLEGYTEKKERKKTVRPFYIDDTIEMVTPVVKRKSKSIPAKKQAAGTESAIRESIHSHKSEKNFVPPFTEEFPFRPLQNHTTNIENFMAEKYLECMYLDKNFLKRLDNEPGAFCPNQKGSDKIKFLAKKGYKMVAYKQELLRNRRPFYHIKYKEGTSTATLKTRQAQELFVQQQTARKEAEAILSKFQERYREKKIRAMLNLAGKLRNYCDSKSKRILPDKAKYLEEVFDTTRKGYYELHRLNPNQYPWDQVKRIHVAFGLPISRDPSRDSVIEESRTVFIDFKKELKILEKRLKEAQSSEEVCWCYYEMCKNSIELKQFEVARVYAKQCIQEAKMKNNLEWVFVTTMLLIKINIQQRNRNDAKTELNNAKDLAEQMGNTNLQEYVAKCSEVVENIEFNMTVGPQVLIKREKKILAIMDNMDMKSEFSHLFRMMSAMPASRRMTVVPGVKATDTQEKASVVLKPRSIGPMTSKDEPGDGSFHSKYSKKGKETSKGVGFMNLIQFHIDDNEK